MGRSYHITPRADDQGGGWNLVMTEDGEEAGGGVFPVNRDEDADKVMDWWQRLPAADREHWMVTAQSLYPVDAYHAHRMAIAYREAQDVGDEWTDAFL